MHCVLAWPCFDGHSYGDFGVGVSRLAIGEPLMPFTGVPPLTQGAATATTGAAQEAVAASVVNPTGATQTVLGTTAGLAQTTPGAIVTTTATTGASMGFGAFTDLNELTSIAWATTFIFQGIKHWKWVQQDRWKWWLLPLIAVVAGYGICYVTSHGDVWVAAAKAVRGGPIGAYNAMLNYSNAKPMGWFSSAE